MTNQVTELAATVFAVKPPAGFSNGRELLDALVRDCAKASQGQLEIIDEQRPSLVLPSWAHKTLDPPGLHRFLDLRFRVLWPRSDAPGIEVCGGNCFTHVQRSNGSAPRRISLAEIHERFPAAAQWVRSVSDIPLTAHIHAVSTWFRAAEGAGWKPKRIALEEFERPDLGIQSGQGRQRIAEPFKSIILARTPIRKPKRIDLTLVGRKKNPRSSSAIETAFRKWWPSLPVSIRHLGIQQAPAIAPPGLSLLIIPDDEDIHDPPWIDWLRINEAAGNLFRIVREQSLHSSDACTNLTFDLFMLAGGIPWTAAVEREDEAVLGLDAGHNRDQRWSRWVCARVNVSDNATSCNIVKTELAEHIPGTAIERLVPHDPAARSMTVFRDGRFHSEDKRDIAPEGMTVSVVKHPRAVLYRQLNGHLRPAQFGDALLYPDGRALLQTSSNKGTASQWKMPIRISTERRDQIERAVALTSLLCRQPALGVWQQPRLPSPIYWADLISKTTSEGWPKVVGRGLGLESLIP